MTLAPPKLRNVVGSVLQHRDDDRGAAAVEYALLLVLIAVVLLVAVAVVGTEASSGLNNAAQSGFVDP